MPTVLAFALFVIASMPQVELVIVREGEKEYHRPGCALVRDGKGVVAMSRGEAEGKRLKPHADCDPSNPRNAQSPAGGESGRPAPPINVFVDGGTYYHREKCTKIKGEPRRIALDEAAKKHWPCRVCKPPIRARKPRT